jgi:hypothetical protein
VRAAGRAGGEKEEEEEAIGVVVSLVRSVGPTTTDAPSDGLSGQRDGQVRALFVCFG